MAQCGPPIGTLEVTVISDGVIKEAVDLWAAERRCRAGGGSRGGTGCGSGVTMARFRSTRTGDVVGPVAHLDLGIEQQVRGTG